MPGKDSSDVRFALVGSLARRGDQVAFALLVEVLRNDKEKSHLRGVAARGMVRIDQARGLALLREESAAFDRATRIHTDELLGKRKKDGY